AGDVRNLLLEANRSVDLEETLHRRGHAVCVDLSARERVTRPYRRAGRGRHPVIDRGRVDRIVLRVPLAAREHLPAGADGVDGGWREVGEVAGDLDVAPPALSRR